MKVTAEYFAVYSGHNFMAWAYCEGWRAEYIARRFETHADAQAFIDAMHPDYRRRLRPEVRHCQVYDTGEIGVA